MDRMTTLRASDANRRVFEQAPFRFYARMVDAPSGEFVEFWFGACDSTQDLAGSVESKISGRTTNEWCQFMMPAYHSQEVVEFGLQRYPDVRMICKGVIDSWGLQVMGTMVDFTIKHETPWERLI